MTEKNKSLLNIHLAVLLFGIGGSFGKLITLPSTITVLGRVIFSSLFLFIILKLKKEKISLNNGSHYFSMIIMGIILAVHWTTFYQSVKMSTVAIALLTFSTFPMFITFIEPYFFKEKLQISDVITALITFIGILFVIPKFEFSNNTTIGAILGIISGFTYAILSILNRKFIKEYSGPLIAFYEQTVSIVVLMPFYFISKPYISMNNLVLTILLGVVFTGIAHTLFIMGLKNIKTQTAGIIGSLEPLYGIICAILLVNEIPTSKVLIGGIFILGAVIYSTIKSKK